MAMGNELQGMELTTDYPDNRYWLIANPQTGNYIILVSDADYIPNDARPLSLIEERDGRQFLTLKFGKV
jgi:hypothetical protein